jgi:hypothetical protein
MLGDQKSRSPSRRVHLFIEQGESKKKSFLLRCHELGLSEADLQARSDGKSPNYTKFVFLTAANKTLNDWIANHRTFKHRDILQSFWSIIDQDECHEKRNKGNIPMDFIQAQSKMVRGGRIPPLIVVMFDTPIVNKITNLEGPVKAFCKIRGGIRRSRGKHLYARAGQIHPRRHTTASSRQGKKGKD